MKEVRVIRALKKGSNVAVHVKDVERGHECNCYCTECNGDFLAIQGVSINRRQWHFRHATKNTGCSGGLETILHQRAKQVLEKGTIIHTKLKGALFYSNPVAEKPLFSIRPDVSAEHNGSSIYFEVAVTHFLEESKRDDIIDKQLRCIEINLSKLSVDSSDEELEYAVLKDVSNKEIIFWSISEEEGQVESYIPIMEMKSLRKPTSLQEILSHPLTIFFLCAGGIWWLFKKFKASTRQDWKHRR